VKALVLAAGYATRLRPLTDTWAKELLPVAGTPIVDTIVERIEEVADVDEIHLVTNARKAAAFERWAEGRDIHVHDDGTTSNDDRLGAIGDMRFVVERAGIDDDLLVIAGDNLFEFSLADFVAFWRGKGRASAIAVRDVGSRELVKRYSVVELGPDDRVLDFVEKPSEPQSTLAAIATYLFHREHVPLIEAYLEAGNEPDQPGRFIAWLHRNEPVFGWRFAGDWFDIGDLEQLQHADNLLRAASGLPQRAAYSPD
jgi:glucose-1-phosphate thymidylyltransferase